MSHLLTEIGLRLLKAGAATVLGILVYGFATRVLGAPATVELGLVSWLVGAAFILLVESSPI
jgi:hypothetical protein